MHVNACGISHRVFRALAAFVSPPPLFCTELWLNAPPHPLPHPLPRLYPSVHDGRHYGVNITGTRGRLEGCDIARNGLGGVNITGADPLLVDCK